MSCLEKKLSTRYANIVIFWTMYADSSVELKKKSELSQESAVAACNMYVPYISDIVRQIEGVVKIFAMEKELRSIKNRGYFPVPQLAPEKCKIETIQDKDALLSEIDETGVEMLKAIKESEEKYKKGARTSQNQG